MLDQGTGPLKYLAITLGLVVLYQYFGEEKKIDAQAIASRDPWFERHIYGEGGPVLLKFGAEWCGPCRSLDANLRTVEPMFRGRIKVVRVDVGEHPELAQTFGVRSIPHSFVIYQGRIVEQRRGSMEIETLRQWIAQVSEKAYRMSPR